MPVTMRYSASLDQTYEDHGASASVGQSLPDLPSASSSPAPSDGAGQDPRHLLLCSPLPGGSGSASGSVSGHGGGSSSDGGGRMTYHDRTSSLDSLNDGSLSSGCGSVGSGSHSRQLSSESCAEFIPTRTVKTTVKPAFNPMQFVKTGASQLGRKAEAQIKRYEEVKKVKEMVKEEEEEWQSNLDNWKSKRKHFSKKTVTRAEEIKQLNEAEHERSSRSRRNKTFNEMMEERSKRATSTSILPVWNDDGEDVDGDNDDAIDEKDPANNNNNNNSSKSDVSFESSGSDHVFHEDEDDMRHHHHHPQNQSNGNGLATIKSNGIQHDSDALSDAGSDVKRGPPTAVAKTPPTNGHGKMVNNDTSIVSAVAATVVDTAQEYTFDKAIQSYTQYAESRTKSTTRVTETKTTTVASLSSERTRTTTPPNPLLAGHDDPPLTNGRSNGSAARGAESPLMDAAAKTTVTVHRDEGEEIMILVCLKRGSETKDFGFATKSVASIGNGPFVESVSAASPAEEAGLHVGDEILAINGESCTAKRTHSAIVFAIKQAVYTGRLELSVYRYKNPELAVLKTTTLASNSSFRGADKNSMTEIRQQKFSVTNGSTGDLSASKVDVVQRRSMFESAPAARASPDRGALNRRSLDVSAKFKDKLASFEQLDSADDSNAASFKEKLASFQSLDSLEAKSRPWGTASSDDGEPARFRQKRNSMENLLDQTEGVARRDPVEVEPAVGVVPVRTHTVSETRQSYEMQQSFERTQSCEFLDSAIDEPQDHLVDEHGNYDVIVAGAPHELEYTNQTTAYEADLPVEQVESQAATACVESGSDLSSLEPDTRDATVTSYDHAGDHRYQDVSNSRHHLSHDSSPSGKSAFELADSLEETAFVGSVPSSPKDIGVYPVASYGANIAADVAQDFDGVAEFRAARSTSVVSDLSPIGEINLELLTINVDLSATPDNVVVVEDFEMPIMSLAPPSEKPPPPPMDHEGGAPEQTTATKIVNLRRVESTKRIRKEISKRRSDFLGIDGEEVQNYIDNEISNVSPPPKMDEFLKADRELSEQCRQDLLRSEQDRHRGLEDFQMNHHGKQSSICSSLNLSNDDCYSDENFTNSEITTLEREIITNLEWEEQQEQVQQLNHQREKHVSGNTDKNREAELVSSPQQPKPKVDTSHSDEANKLREREEELRRQEEMLQLEKKKLREEQESLLKIKEAYQKQIEEHNQRSQVSHEPAEQVTPQPPPQLPTPQQQQLPQRQHSQNNVHQSQPSLVLSSQPASQEGRNRQAPLPPNKPRVASPAGLNLDLSGHDSTVAPHSQQSFADRDNDGQRRHPSATDERLPAATHQSPDPVAPLPQATPLTPTTPTSKKQALYALSASPKAKLLDGDEWMAARRQAELNGLSASTGNLAGPTTPRRENYNPNQHWVVQEAEFRRLHAPERTSVPPASTTSDLASTKRSLAFSDRNLYTQSTSANQRKVESSSGVSPHYESPVNLNIAQGAGGSPYHHGNQQPHPPQPHPQQQQHNRPPPPNKPLPPIPTSVNGAGHHAPSPAAQQQQQRLTGTAPVSRYAVGLPPHPQGALPSPPHGQQQPQHYHHHQPPQQQAYQSSPHNHHHPAAHQMAPQAHYGINGSARPEQGQEARINAPAQTACSPPVPKSNGHGAVDKETQMLSVSGKKKCSHCNEELGRGAAMIIESLQLFYHINCFKCCVCHTQLGNGSSGADVRVRSQKLHCHNCYSNDEGLKFSKV